ncbi:MAG: ribosomal protein L13e [Promethearchaeota archaeon]
MVDKLNQVALVKSPGKDAHTRRGNGFSLEEIKQAGVPINTLKKSKVQIDYFRKSANSNNIKKLKSLEIPSLDRKKKKPFVPKEKKKTPFKPEEMKKKAKPKKSSTKPVSKPIKKEKVKPTKKEKAITSKIEKVEKVPILSTGTPLTDLSGLGAATAKKFIELGVDTIEALIEEKSEELASLIKGVSEDRIKKWIEEGKDIIK